MLPTSLAGKARAMRWLARGSAIATPIAYAALWTRFSWASGMLRDALPGLETAGVGVAQLITGFWLGMVPVALAAAALWQAAQFFGLYEADDLFPPAAALALRRLGKLLVATAVASIIVRTLAGLVFSLHLPAGQKQLVIAFSSSDVFLLIFGGLMLMIGHILAEAARIAAENRQFV